jgi:hypothetical protein
MLFRRSKPGETVQQTIQRATVQPVQPKRPVLTLGVDEEGRPRGVFVDERVHMAVVGFPGVGKSRLLLSLAVQDVRRGRGVLIIDPHGDLVKLFLTHVPRERWDDVIYIDPTTARDYGRVVKINFLEVRDPKDRDIVARCFMESLEKIYARFWGPRLDMILMNAIYTLLDSGDTNLSHLYNVIADETFREDCLQRVGDERVKAFWENEFRKMPRDASGAALTKIYRIVQERIVAPMFECEKSGFDFRKAMDEGKIIVVNLSEGAITSDVANFLGSLILSRVYLAGMSREDTPEEKRVPFYVYIDEAYRFVSDSIRDILQSLRKYRVYMTLASQYLGQYKKEIAESIPHLCDAIITFSAGEETAKKLQEFYKPFLNYSDLTHLPKFTFAASAVVGGKRECQILRSIDLGRGPNNPDEVIAYSLQKEWAEPVDMSRYAGVPAAGELDHPTRRGFKNPLMWAIALKLYRLYVENRGRGMASQGSMPAMERGELLEAMHREFGVQPAQVDAALNHLVYVGYVRYREKPYVWDALAVPVEACWQPKPQLCCKCDELTHRPYYLKGGKFICKLCLEKMLYTGGYAPEDVVEPRLDADKIRADRPVQRRTVKRFFYLTTRGINEVEQIPTGRRGGGPEHTLLIAKLQELLWDNYCWVRVDEGEEAPKRAEGGKGEYETKKMPDITVVPLTRDPDGKWNPRYWDNAHAFTVEVEIDPIKHRQRVVNNLVKNKGFGKPVIFATTRERWANGLVDILHNELKEDVVFDCTGFFGGLWDNTKVSVLYFNPETGERVFLTNNQLLPIQEEPPQKEEATQQQKTTQETKGKTEEKAEEKAEGAEAKAEVKAEKEAGGAEEKAEVKAGELAAEEKVEEPEKQPAGVVATVKAEDVRHLYSVFTQDPWRLVKQETADGKIVLVAEAKAAGGVVTVTLGPYEEHEKALKLLRIEPAFRPYVAEKKVPQPAVETSMKTEAVMEKPVPKTEEGVESSHLLRDLEEEIRKYSELGFSFTVKMIRGKPWLYAQKRIEGKVKSKSVAVWDEKVSEIALRLGIKIGKGAKREAEKET